MLVALLITFGYFMVFFIVATIIKNNSIVDIGWGFGFVLVSWLLFFISGELTLIKIIVNILVSLWGLRLFYYILKRNLFEEEDFRYKNWREEWGKWVIPRAFIQVFMLQGLLQFLIGSAVYYINVYNPEISTIGYVGLGVWAFGYLFEVVGDYQLKQHIKKGTKGLMTSGLWKITRHPNYFGEATMWWGLFIFAFLSGVPFYYIVSPLTITIVLRYISTPLLEDKMKQYEGWAEYRAKTSMIFPFLGSK